MKKLFVQLRDTFVAGLIFLMPLAIVGILLGKLYVLASTKSTKLAVLLGVKGVWGISGAGVLGLVFIFLTCLLFGLLMRVSLFHSMSQYLDKKMAEYIPGYGVYREMALEKLAAARKNPPYECVVWARIADHWQPGFLVKRMDNGHCLVFIQQAGTAAKQLGSLHLLTHLQIKECPQVPMDELLTSIEQRGAQWPDSFKPPAV
jgi:hypothetical protein